MLTSLVRMRARIARLQSIDRWPLPRLVRDPESERVRRIEDAIVSLPPQTREVFMMHRFENLGYDRIAHRLDLSIADVERHIAKALLRLCHALEDIL
ncbi:sigma factor-like helix-turn-helix DNA-binding protein [Sphingomonas cavernae]|uniref:RNA polymerase sigma factor 70 region 4 type 2 domain-containing protein n=1 Tax=Sphingomonas cavernae TaxID=2320861 RepID=A0A418WPK7_9SPHN|nr:sigma factor-like helix-turn-helix DNA-binding protein [Sphingomonas cavernae]RJF86115.1 hypothetical protein D3876_20080 [Sphingomonas cavernae]RJF93192.1 hypothetical protein D3876_02195 [Sphingomonas cavernae]